MKIVRLSALLLLALPLVARPQNPAGELERLLESRAAAAEALGVPELWIEAEAAADLAGEIDTADLDAALDRLLAPQRELGPRATLLLIAMRLNGENPDPERIVPRLLSLVDHEDPQVAIGAAGLLAGGRLRGIDEEALEDARARLLALARDVDREPTLRIEMAVAAVRLGDGETRRAARAELRAFLASSDPALRARAALALARVGDLETARDELERIAELPGPEGELATAFLKAAAERDYRERELRNARRQYKELLERSGPPDDLQRVDRVIRMIQTQHIEGDQVTREELLDASLDGMLHSLDRHSAYMPPKVYERFDQDLQAEYGGIGAYVNTDPDDNLFTITQPIYDGPAYRAGLRTDDKIVRIDDWPTIGKDQEEIIRHLKGKPGTKVKLYIWQAGMDPALIERPTEDMAVVVERAYITIPPLKSDLLPGDIALIELSQFSRVASQELERTLRDVQSKHVRGVVLDLRNNPGGLLSEARDVADLFLPEGKLVVTTESRLEPDRKLYTRRPAVVPADLPVVVLVNRFTASAAEIVSGALQDHGRALLVGQRTFGKGSVQNIFPVAGERDDEFRDENGNHRHDPWEPLTKDWNGNGKFDLAPRVKITIARYLLPSGRSIHRAFDRDGNLISPGGVEPDRDVAQLRWDIWRIEEARRLQREHKVREYVDERWDEHHALFGELAVCDDDDTTRYPDFEEFYQSLDTPLPRQDVRFLLRAEIRRRVQDDRGAAFPAGDFQEDVQLQAAIEEVLKRRGQTIYDIPHYALTFDLDQLDSEVHGGGPVAKGDAEDRRHTVKSALALLAQARREEGGLDKAQLEELARLLSQLDG